ncbi:hypothetical protein RvY_17634 [Ramazzottius varieornatus]|uniref:Uncharacterized protein n=1 Tax=Ramazzottius varieornatus TaxID=947166 RepID=A0A1D1W2V1_RAMVA|nr:hypothetical protein RvY_17634 [Ramazzottius varieornatus]
MLELILLFLAGSYAAPVHVSDVDVLQFALTVENLASTFYIQGLQKHPKEEFLNAGVKEADYDQIVRVRDNEAGHRDTLKAAIQKLGGTPNPPCQYKFPDDDIPSFLKVARTLENADIPAYTGSIKDLTDKRLITAAGTIVTVDARHAAFFNHITGKAPAPASFDIPLGQRQISSLAKQFIVSCPHPIPEPFPELKLTPESGPAGSAVTLATSAPLRGVNCAIITATGITFSPVQDNKCTIPQASGGVYVVLTSASDSRGLSDDNTLGIAPFIVAARGDAV